MAEALLLTVAGTIAIISAVVFFISFMVRIRADRSAHALEKVLAPLEEQIHVKNAPVTDAQVREMVKTADLGSLARDDTALRRIESVLYLVAERQRRRAEGRLSFWAALSHGRPAGRFELDSLPLQARAGLLSPPDEIRNAPDAVELPLVRHGLTRHAVPFGEGMQLVLVTLSPGAPQQDDGIAHEAHQYTRIVSGKLRMNIEGFGELILAPGECVFVPVGTKHTTNCEGDEELVGYDLFVDAA